MKSKLMEKAWFLGLCAGLLTGGVSYIWLKAPRQSNKESPIKRSFIKRSFLVKPPQSGAQFSPDQIIIQFKATATRTDRERVFRFLGTTNSDVHSIKPRPSSIAARAAIRQTIGSGDVNLVRISLNRTDGSASTAIPYPHFHVAALTGSRTTGRQRELYPNSKIMLANDGPKSMQVQPGPSFEDLLIKVQRDPAVYHAQRNYKYHITAQYPANDSLYTKGILWGVASSGSPAPIGPISNLYGTEAEKLWQVNQTGSRSVCIGIVDSGVDMTHPDLAANIDINDARDFYRVSGDSNYNVDENGHGTHVAGIIGAGENGFGVVGVAWQVTMIPVKFIGPDGSGDTANAVQAFNYLVGLRQRGMNIVAINASFYSDDADPLLLAAIKSAARAGIVTVSAAANSHQDIGANRVYPASFDTSSDNTDQSGTLPFNSNITVAAINLSGQRASFSNYGGTVELGAPGVGIVSTMIANPDQSLISDKSAIVTESNGGTYASLDGTSMAAPYVTGAIVLLASAHLSSNGHTTLAAQDICAQIKRDAASTPTPSMSGIVTTGRLDIAKLIQVTSP